LVAPRLPIKLTVKQPAATKNQGKETTAKPTRKEQRQARREAKNAQKAAKGKKP
jgi:hypothetical protein